MSKNVLIIGAGPIGREYYDILNQENVSLEILTRSDKLKFLENEFEILDTQGNYLLIKITDE